MADQFDRFDEHARRVLTFAHEEAVRLDRNYIGTEHLLLGLVREGDGVAATVLNKLGVRLPKARSAVEFIIGRGKPGTIIEIGLTPRAKNVLRLAEIEARNLNHRYVGTEHLLLGLAGELDGMAAGVLYSLGVSLERVCAETLRAIEDIERATNSPLTTTQKLRMQMEATDGTTAELRAALDRARQESHQRGNADIDTEHFLLAMAQMECIASRVLTRLEIDLTNLQHMMEFLLAQRRTEVAGASGLSVRAKKVIDLAGAEARRYEHPELNSGHLLLGIVRVQRGLASGALEALGVSLESARMELVIIVG